MSDYDLNKVDKAVVKLDKYVTLLRVKYGYTLEQAKKEIGKRVAGYEAEERMAADLHDSTDTLKTEKQKLNKELLENDSLGG